MIIQKLNVYKYSAAYLNLLRPSLRQNVQNSRDSQHATADICIFERIFPHFSPYF